MYCETRAFLEVNICHFHLRGRNVGKYVTELNNDELMSDISVVVTELSSICLQSIEMSINLLVLSPLIQ